MTRRIALTAVLGSITAATLILGLTACVPESSTTASSPATDLPAQSASPEAGGSTPAADGIVAVPTSCEQLVPAEQLAALDHLALNDPAVDEGTLRSGLSNPALAELAEANRVLGCVWENPGASTTALHTTVARIDGGEGAAAVKLLTDDKVDCYEAQQGIRCEYALTGGAVDSGETHFFRDDIWIATSWVNVAPPGYTNAIVGTLWP